jgi:hypothetical protein
MDDFANQGLCLTAAVWMQLRAALLLAKKRFAETTRPEATARTGQSINTFLQRFRKGSKPFRNVINRSIYQYDSVTSLPVLTSFCHIVDIPIPSEIIAKNFVSGWNCSFLDNNFRDFIFKCHNNLLKTGDRLSHILTNYNDSCFLCRNLVSSTEWRETFRHIFWDCPVTSNILKRFNAHFKIIPTDNTTKFNKLYWFGDRNDQLDKCALLLYDIFRYQLWCMKQRKIYDLQSIIDNTVNMLNAIFVVKPSLCQTFRNNNNLANILQAMG